MLVLLPCPAPEQKINKCAGQKFFLVGTNFKQATLRNISILWTKEVQDAQMSDRTGVLLGEQVKVQSVKSRKLCLMSDIEENPRRK